jgi:phosphohistidine swiveling domain-containing protein
MRYIVSSSEHDARDPQLAGRKAATLAHLGTLGFPVPSGGIITTRLCREVRSSAGGKSVALLEAGRSLEQTAPETDVATLLEPIHLPREFLEELRAFLAQYPPDKRFAVRSSSPQEDSAAATFAGQFDTHLNCAGFDGISDAVVRCLLSLWSPRAISYRRFHQVVEPPSMAILIQEMVDCDVAGVAFSINPVSGNLNEIVVNAHPGLGQVVVDGSTEIEQFVLPKPKIGGAAARDADAGTNGDAKRVNGEGNIGACLQPKELAAIAGLVATLEARESFPQDVEWGLCAGEIFLLQSRPVTAIPPRWSRDSSAERFPYPVTPLAWDFIEEGFHKSLAKSLSIMDLPPFTGRWFSSHNHFVYFNQNAMELYGRRRATAFRHLKEGTKGLRAMLKEVAWVYRPLDHWNRHIDAYLARLGEFSSWSVADKDEAALWAFALDIRKLAYNYFAPNVAISMAHALLFNALRQTLHILLGREDGERAIFDLTAACNTKTALVNEELCELAALVRENPRLEAAVRTLPAREALAELRRDAVVSPVLQQFIDAHYHRELDHFLDPYYPTLGEAPWSVVDNIKLIFDGSFAGGNSIGTAGDGQSAQRRQYEARSRVLARCPADCQPDLLELIELTRAYIALDDVEHYQTSRLQVPARRCLQALGQHLVRRGVIEDGDDIFFSRLRTLEKAMITRSFRDLTDEIQRSKASFFAAADATPEFVIGAAATTPGDATATLTGLACSGGVAEGEVQIIRSTEDFGKFPRGAVLVARATPPSWTSLFYSAAAVVTEAGGPLSHGAIIAREIGIPAVMGVRGALSSLEDGDRVRVDGTLGHIVKLDQ